MELRDRYRGCLLGLAVGDAVGTTLEFVRRRHPGRNDADTTAAVCGQVAGAHYGVGAIPREWRERLALADEITGLADRIHDRPK